MSGMQRLLLDTQSVEFGLLNDWQRDFPLLPRPFDHIASCVGWSEQRVIDLYLDWVSAGAVSRVGAVFAPGRLGAGALVALRVAPERLEEVAARVSAETAVNHNYEREHTFNLWFVASASDELALQALVRRIERDTGCFALILPMEEEFHIDLGFDLSGKPATRRVQDGCRVNGEQDRACAIPQLERQLFAALQVGLPIVSQPWAHLGRRVGLNEGMVIETVARALEDGLIRRFGVVVRHRELGIGSNAMCVWDIPDALAGSLGRQLAAQPGVTLCYRRRRCPPHWRYNLFCMIHGCAREAVQAQRDEMARAIGLDRWPHAVLFSGRRFKQRGARYLATEPERDHGE